MSFVILCQYNTRRVHRPASSWVQKEVHPGFEPGLLEGARVVKIQSDNHYTNEPIDH